VRSCDGARDRHTLPEAEACLLVGEQRELYLLEQQPGEEAPYERLLGDAIAGEGALFTHGLLWRPPGTWSIQS